MSFFYEFPHTHTYDSDLSWLISRMKKLLEDFAATVERVDDLEDAMREALDSIPQQIKDEIQGMVDDGTFEEIIKQLTEDLEARITTAENAITTINNWRQTLIVNNLTSSDTDKALSALQGKVLKELIDGAKNDITALTTRVTTAENNIITATNAISTINNTLTTYDSRIAALEAQNVINVINNLTSTSTTDALSANMGKELYQNYVVKQITFNVDMYEATDKAERPKLTIQPGEQLKLVFTINNAQLPNLELLSYVSRMLEARLLDIIATNSNQNIIYSQPIAEITVPTQNTVLAIFKNISTTDYVIQSAVTKQNFIEKIKLYYKAIGTEYVSEETYDTTTVSAVIEPISNITVIDSVGSTSTTDALSANMGKTLADLIQQLATSVANDWATLATVATTGDYNDLINLPGIPSGYRLIAKSIPMNGSLVRQVDSNDHDINLWMANSSDINWGSGDNTKNALAIATTFTVVYYIDNSYTEYTQTIPLVIFNNSTTVSLEKYFLGNIDAVIPIARKATESSGSYTYTQNKSSLGTALSEDTIHINARIQNGVSGGGTIHLTAPTGGIKSAKFGNSYALSLTPYTEV